MPLNSLSNWTRSDQERLNFFELLLGSVFQPNSNAQSIRKHRSPLQLQTYFIFKEITNEIARNNIKKDPDIDLISKSQGKQNDLYAMFIQCNYQNQR